MSLRHGKRAKHDNGVQPRAPRGRRQFDPEQAAPDGSAAAGRFGGYGQAGYDEQAADEPGVQVDFDEEENRQLDDQAREKKIQRKDTSSDEVKAKKTKKKKDH